MKLFNKTRIPNEILEPLLIAAGRCVGAKTSKVVVKVTRGRNGSVRGVAHSAIVVYSWHLKRVSKWKSARANTDGGWFKLTIPQIQQGMDSLAVAESVFCVAAHEWAHIKDYQVGRWNLPWSSTGLGGRRPRHDSRPEEVRAINAIDDALERGAVRRNQDLIIEFALAMDVAGQAPARRGKPISGGLAETGDA